jgi:hypothetical protein
MILLGIVDIQSGKTIFHRRYESLKDVSKDTRTSIRTLKKIINGEIVHKFYRLHTTF